VSIVTKPKNIKILYNDIPRDKNSGSNNLHHRANNECDQYICEVCHYNTVIKIIMTNIYRLKNI
jgi:hypothetical protein